MIITNNGTSTINGWTLKFAFNGDQKITQIWNGLASQTGNQVTVTNARNASYNGTIAPGQSVSLGFNGTWATSDANPTAFTLNGSPTTLN